MTLGKRNTMKAVLGAVAFAWVAMSPAHAAITYDIGGGASEIPGLATFQTTGATMGGMSVTATFTNGFSETLTWAATGANSGGVTGTGWSLTQSGDTWAGLWNFNFLNPTGASPLSLMSLQLTGNPGLTVFDRTFGGVEGTPDSANGHDLSFTDSTITALVTFSDWVNVTGSAAVGDIFHELLVEFGDAGIRQDFAFLQDTDNDNRYGQVPEPGTASLLGLALAGLGWKVRNRKTTN